MIRIESSKAIFAGVASKTLFAGPPRSSKRADMPRGSLRDPSKNSELELSILLKKFSSPKKIASSAAQFLKDSSQPLVAIHPGSGSKEKNWPVQNWIELFSIEHWHIEKRPSLFVVSGEADKEQAARLEHTWKNQEICFAKNLPLSHLAGVLEHSIFIGHDSGISHVAAAAGANCILLFGPTDPNVWAPRNENVEVLRARNGKVNDLEIALVRAALTEALHADSKLVNPDLQQDPEFLSP